MKTRIELAQKAIQEAEYTSIEGRFTTKIPL